MIRRRNNHKIMQEKKYSQSMKHEGKQVEEPVPEELSYCRLSGGGPLRHNPIKNGLFLS